MAIFSKDSVETWLKFLQDGKKILNPLILPAATCNKIIMLLKEINGDRTCLILKCLTMGIFWILWVKLLSFNYGFYIFMMLR